MSYRGRAHLNVTLYGHDDETGESETGVMRRLPLSASTTTPVARVVAGPGMLSFAVIPATGRLMIGREPGCGLVLDHGSVSRRHAAVTLEDNAMVVEDLGSTNGTWRDGRRLVHRERIEAGDSISLGQVVIRLENLGEHEVAHLHRVAANIEAASRDPLTGLSTRRWLLDELPRVIAQHEDYGRPLTAIFLDIDHFKSINDTFGHPMGDEVLRTAGRLAQNAIRGTDVAIRYGGEEILLVLRETDADVGYRVAERLRLMVQAHPWAQHGLGERVVTVSAGVAAYVHGEGVTPWFERADRAMYAAKRGGRNNTCIL